MRTRVASEVMWNTAKNSSVTTEYFQNESSLYFYVFKSYKNLKIERLGEYFLTQPGLLMWKYKAQSNYKLFSNKSLNDTLEF